MGNWEGLRLAPIGSQHAYGVFLARPVDADVGDGGELGNCSQMRSFVQSDTDGAAVTGAIPGSR